MGSTRGFACELVRMNRRTHPPVIRSRNPQLIDAIGKLPAIARRTSTWQTAYLASRIGKKRSTLQAFVTDPSSPQSAPGASRWIRHLDQVGCDPQDPPAVKSSHHR